MESRNESFIVGNNPMADSIHPRPSATASADARYLGAWNEINTRIAQRQNLLSIYTTLALASAGAASIVTPAPPTWRFVYAIPLLSLLFAVLLRMHEQQIAILRAFLADLERANKIVPGFHLPNKRSARAQEIRKLHDYCCLGLVTGFLMIAAMIWWLSLAHGLIHAFDWSAMPISVICGVISLWMISSNSQSREKLFRELEASDGDPR
jgi:hypothetical protein